MTNAWVASYVALWCIAAVLAFIVMGLARQLGLIQLRLGIDPGVLITNEGLERGVRAPDFEATDILSGRSLRLSDFKGLRTVLVFLTPSCEACRKLVPHLNSLAKEEKGRSAVLAVCPAADAACLHFADDLVQLGIDTLVL